METWIALPTSRLPRANSPWSSITAIIKLDPERAWELLDLMRDITSKAQQSSRTFKISSFEPNALYVPTHALLETPAANNFLVLPPDFEVSDITPVKVIHADVIPYFVSWEAYDPEETFKLTTAMLDSLTLEAISKGLTFPPMSTRETLEQLATRSNSLFTLTKTWLSKV
jgi:hypothetical protein